MTLRDTINLLQGLPPMDAFQLILLIEVGIIAAATLFGLPWRR